MSQEGQSAASVDEVQKMLATLEDVWDKLNDNWDNRKLMLTQLYDLKVCMAETSFKVQQFSAIICL